jgi:hypothetical protein
MINNTYRADTELLYQESPHVSYQRDFDDQFPSPFEWETLVKITIRWVEKVVAMADNLDLMFQENRGESVQTS